jgi:hypothetical protein
MDRLLPENSGQLRNLQKLRGDTANSERHRQSSRPKRGQKLTIFCDHFSGTGTTLAANVS